MNEEGFLEFMYSFDQIIKGIKNPRLFIREMERKKIILYNSYNRFLNSLEGTKFLNKDWDNLILLDACRFDIFNEHNTICGSLSSIKSNASSSDEYFKKNFEHGEYRDIVYYSANPHIDNIDAKFFDIIRLWETDWNEKYGTVLPSEAVNRVLETMDNYPNKRLIIHLMQPHRPFIGELADDFQQSGFSREGVNIAPGEDPEVPFWWDRMENGELEKHTVWNMYEENLKIALPHVQRLVEELPGKTVISSDHGNAFGERGLYGHPSYRHHNKLVNVPWLVIDKPRKRIIPGESSILAKREHSFQTKERLESLGYIE